MLKLFTEDSLKKNQEKLAERQVANNKKGTSNNTTNVEHNQGEELRKKCPNLALIEGQPLPSKYLQEFSQKPVVGGDGGDQEGNSAGGAIIRFGVPIEEIDDFYENTYIVIGQEKEHSSKCPPIIYRFNALNPTYPVSPLNPVRRYATTILTHWISRILLSVVLVLNFFVLITGLLERLPRPGNLCFEIGFLLIYAFELCVRISARGLFKGEFTCSWSFWTWLDFAVIIFGICGLVHPDSFNQSFAGIRILKIVPLIPSLRNWWNFLFTIVLTLLKCILPLSFALTCYYAIFGIHLYSGILTTKCILNYTATHEGDEGTPESRRYFYNSSQNWLREDWHLDSEAVLCGKNAKCPNGYVCVQGFGSNPDNNYTSFDSFSWALLSLLRIVTQDFMEALYQMIANVLGTSHIIFFIVPFFIITLPTLSFVVAVIAKYFHENLQENGEQNGEENENQEEACQQPKNTTCDESKFWNVICCNFTCCVRPGKSTQDFAKSIVSRPIFEMAITTVLVLDLLTLSMHHFDMAAQVQQIRLVLFGIYGFVYIVEFLLKYMAGGGLKSYLEKEGNPLALFIVFLLIIQLVAFITDFNLSLLAQLSLFRPLRLAYKWNTLRLILKIIANSVKDFWVVFLLMIMYFTIFAHIGTTMYGSAYMTNITDANSKSNPQQQNSSIPRWHFIDFPHSFLNVFRMLCGEWIETLWDCLTATTIEELIANENNTSTTITSTKCYLYYTFALLIGNFLLLCAAIGVVLTTIKTLHFTKENPRTKSAVERICRSICLPINGVDGDGENGDERILMESYNHHHPQMSNEIDSALAAATAVTGTSIEPTSPQAGCEGCCARCSTKIGNIRTSKLYDAVAIVLIAVTSLSYVIVANYADKEWVRSYQKYFNFRSYLTLFFNIWFTLIEVPFKFIQFGCKGFFTNVGCVFDLLVAVAIWTEALTIEFGIRQPTVVMILVFARPFLLIDRVERLRICCRALFNQVRLIRKYVFAAAFVWLLFAIQGIWLFSGKYFKCTTELDLKIWTHLQHQMDNVETLEHCQHRNFTWSRSDLHFDDISEALLSLSFTSIFLGWIHVLHNAVDTTEVHKQPMREASYGMILYFLAFIIIGVFFLSNILIGVFVYNLETDEARLQFLSDDQKKSYKTRKDKLISKTVSASTSELAQQKVVQEKVQIPEPTWKVNKFLYSVVTDMRFEIAVFGVILLDVFLSGCQSFGQSTTEEMVLMHVQLIILAIYIIEMIIKIVAWRRYYFTTAWNIFDFIIVLICILDLILTHTVEDFDSFGIFRILRLLRIYRLLNFNEHFSDCAENCYRKPSTPEKLLIKPMESRIFSQVYDVVTNFRFDAFIMVLILVDFYEIHFNLSNLTPFENTFCFILIPIIYYIELLVKLIAWRQYYFRSIWNILDFLALIGITLRFGRILGFGWNGDSPYFIFDILLILETLRIARILRFIPLWQYGIWSRKSIANICKSLKLETLRRALVFAFPTLLNLFLFFLIIIFTFSFFGIVLFADVKWTRALDSVTNFVSFGPAFSALVQLSWFSGTDGIYFGLSNMADCGSPNIEHRQEKNVNKPLGCGNPFNAKIFLTVYCGLSGLIFLNMFLTLILETIHQLSINDSENDREEDVDADADGDTAGTDSSRRKRMSNLMSSNEPNNKTVIFKSKKVSITYASGSKNQSEESISEEINLSGSENEIMKNAA